MSRNYVSRNYGATKVAAHLLNTLTTIFIHGFTRSMALLPLPLNHVLGNLIGWLLWIVPNRNRSNALVNIKICYPELEQSEQRQMARQSLLETGKTVTEVGWFWFRKESDVRKKIIFPQEDSAFRHVTSDSEQQNSGTDQTPTIFITPHFGAWELCPVLFSPFNTAYLYRPPRVAALEGLIKAGRTRYGGELLAITSAGIKQLLRALRKGHSIGILPDQEPDRQNGVFAPFFSTPANTMTLLSSVGSRTQANIVCLAIQRLPRGRGYHVHHIDVTQGITDADPLVSATAINRLVEACIAVEPAQYSWSYRRFRLMPDESEGKRSYKNKES